MKQIFILLFSSLLLVGCSSVKEFVLTSPDHSQSLTIVYRPRFRLFIFDGKEAHFKINHAIISLKNVSDFDESVFICWNEGKYRWSLTRPGGIITKNDLDTNFFNLTTKFELDERGLPDSKKYHSNGCFEFGMDVGDAFPLGACIVEKVHF